MAKKEEINKKEQEEQNQTLWAKYGRVYGYKLEESRFLQDEGWETRFTGEDFLEMKERFLDQVRERNDRDYLCGRWKEGLFDSVDKYLTIHTAYVFNWLPLGPMCTQPFATTGGRQPEQGDTMEVLHPIDITFDDLEEWSWGPNGKFMAWRDKKDGTPGFVHNGLFASSWWKGTVPKGIETVEFTSEGVYVLYPYLDQDVIHEGLTLKAHRWKPPSQYTEQKEGVIILTKGGERRCKNYPTIDVDIGGTAWEVRHVGELQERIRPRVRPAQMYRLLGKYVSMRYLQIPKIEYPIVYRRQGDIQPPFFQDGTLHIDTSQRQSVLSAHHQGDIVRYTYGRHTIVRHKSSPAPSLYLFSTAQTSRFGVKAFFEQSDNIMLFKDGTKKWDFIGGKVEARDASTQAALRREISEETGHDYKGKMVYLGTSQEHEWVTVLYKIEPFKPQRGRFAEWRPGMDTVPWLPRLVHHVQGEGLPRATSFFTEMSCTGQGAKLLEHIIKQEALSTARLNIVSGSTRVNHVMAAHVLFMFKMFFKLQPLHSYLFLDQIRKEYVVHKYIPPDPYQIYRVMNILAGYISEGPPRYQISVVPGSDTELVGQAVF